MLWSKMFDCCISWCFCRSDCKGLFDAVGGRLGSHALLRHPCHCCVLSSTGRGAIGRSVRLSGKSFTCMLYSSSITYLSAAITSVESRASTHVNLYLRGRGSEPASATTSQADIIAQATNRTSQRASSDASALFGVQTGVRSSSSHVEEDLEDADDAKE